MPRRVLVAGVGNVFLGDDGFGPEVARRLIESRPPDAKVVDFGIRGVHLAYELLDGYDLLVLVDTVRRGDPPGTVSTIEVNIGEAPQMPAAAGMVDGHGLQPDAVFSLLRSLGGELPDVVVVGCEPADLDEGMGLSEAVAGAVGPAVHAVLDVLDRIATTEGAR